MSRITEFKPQTRIPAEQSVQELLARMRSGDRSAVGEFLDAYGGLIQARYRRKLGRLLRRVFDSEDLLSTVRRRLDRCVVSGKLQAETEAQLWALVGRLADRAVSSQARRLKHAPIYDQEDRQFLDELLGVTARNDREERREIVREIFGRMSATERVIAVGTLRGQSQAELGEQLGMSEGAVKQRWFRVRGKIRQELAASE